MELVTSKLKISVPNPCNQLWEDMDLSQNGRYCQNCEKEVIDFTEMSNVELQSWFGSPKEKICGRFNPSQLTRNDLPAHNYWKIASAKILIVSFLTFVAGLRVNAAVNSGEKTAYHQVNHLSPSIEIQKLEVFRIDSVVIVKGKINSSRDKLPLVGIVVSVRDGLQNVSSNKKGDFLIKIPAIPNQKITLTFSHLGFETKEVEITDNQINPVNVVAYTVERHMSIVGGLVAIIKRVPWYKRTWNYIKRLF